MSAPSPIPDLDLDEQDERVLAVIWEKERQGKLPEPRPVMTPPPRRPRQKAR